MTAIRKTPTRRANESSLAKQIERQKRIEASRIKVREWDAANPIGTKVRIKGYFGEHTTTTTSSGCIDRDGYAVVSVMHVGYSVLLTDCEVVK